MLRLSSSQTSLGKPKISWGEPALRLRTQLICEQDIIPHQYYGYRNLVIFLIVVSTGLIEPSPQSEQTVPLITSLTLISALKLVLPLASR